MKIDPAEHRELVSGRRRGLKASLLRGVLALAEIPYRIAVGWRNRRFDQVAGRVQQVAVPVISVGNLTTGGTGKTPMVLWIARWYRRQGLRVALISRGYGAEQGSVNDEALELEQRLPDVPHLQDPDRVKVAQIAIEELDSQLLVLDDAFQHRRIHRDLDIVLIDALAPFGYDHLLPRGLLREPMASLARADVVVLTRADLVDRASRDSIRKCVAQHAAQAIWLEGSHRPQQLISASGDIESLDQLQGRRVVAFCGIGHPDAFERTLATLPIDVAGFRIFADHYRYTRQDVDELAQWIGQHDDISVVLCTHKDLVKLQTEQLGGVRLLAIQVEMQLEGDTDSFQQRLRQWLPIPSHGDTVA